MGQLHSHYHIPNNLINNNMKILIIAASAFPKDEPIDTRSAAGYENCYCHCSNYVYKDNNGITQGNCKSSDDVAQWCFVDPLFSDCSDLVKHEKLDKFWSYEACATPDLGSHQCPIYYDD